MQKHIADNSMLMRRVFRVLIIALTVVVTLAGVELYRILNPQHYYYGYPMPIEEIGELNNGAYCVALDPYNRMCFSTEAEMMDYSNRRHEIGEEIATRTLLASPANH
jgi:hypothetical protein